MRYTVHHNALRIDYNVSTDKPTVVNLTNHSYFNLSADNKPILNEELMLPADKYTPVDAGLIPTGVLAPVEGTPFDFRKSTVIGARINDNNEQLKIAGGYDHNWVLARKERRGEDCGASLRSGERACADGDDDGAGRAVLLRQLSGWDEVRQGAGRACEELRVVSGDAAFSRFAESSELSDDGVEAGGDAAQHDDLHLLDAGQVGQREMRGVCCSAAQEFRFDE